MTSAIDRLLASARGRIAPRLAPSELDAVAAIGGLVVDTRSVEQRRRDGELPGAIPIERNVLEWRLDPASPDRLPEMDDPSKPVVVVCDEGYASSLAAAVLMDLGLTNVTDLEGGYQAWIRWSMRQGSRGSVASVPPPSSPVERGAEVVASLTDPGRNHAEAHQDGESLATHTEAQY
jgi:rhodanese-related sulfurtransferase